MLLRGVISQCTHGQHSIFFVSSVVVMVFYVSGSSHIWWICSRDVIVIKLLHFICHSKFKHLLPSGLNIRWTVNKYTKLKYSHALIKFDWYYTDQSFTQPKAFTHVLWLWSRRHKHNTWVVNITVTFRAREMVYWCGLSVNCDFATCSGVGDGGSAVDGVSATEGFDIPSGELCAGRGLSFPHIESLPYHMKHQYTTKLTPHFWTTFRLTIIANISSFS